MEKNTKVVLTEKWWNDNKAKTLVDKGNVGKTLKLAEGAFKLAFVAKGKELVKQVNAALGICEALDKAALSTAGACLPKVHGDTAFVLKNTFKAEVEKHRKLLSKHLADYQSEIKKITIHEIVKDKTLMVAFIQFAAKSHFDHEPRFVISAVKKSADIYKQFIEAGSKDEINISGSLRSEFKKFFDKGEIQKAPWDKAILESMGVCTQYVPKFQEELLKAA